MVLFASVIKTPNDLYPYLTIVTNEDGVVVASKPVASSEKAQECINEAKFALHKKMIHRRCGRFTRMAQR